MSEQDAYARGMEAAASIVEHFLSDADERWPADFGKREGKNVLRNAAAVIRLSKSSGYRPGDPK